MLCRFVLNLSLLCLALPSFATSPAKEKPALNILAPDLPGASEEGGHGRDIAIVDRTLAYCGYEANFLIQPFGRHWLSFQYLERADGVMTVPLAESLPGFPTAAYIWCQNGAFYDASEQASIETLDDLDGLDVVTFQDGPKILGLEKKAEAFGSILTIADQTIHSRLLLRGRVDAILADGLIIAEVNERLIEESERSDRLVSKQAQLEFAPIFNPSPYKMVFKESGIAEEFDRCFDDLFRQGVIMRISDYYTEKHKENLKHRYLAQ